MDGKNPALEPGFLCSNPSKHYQVELCDLRRIPLLLDSLVSLSKSWFYQRVIVRLNCQEPRCRAAPGYPSRLVDGIIEVEMVARPAGMTVSTLKDAYFQM